MSRCMNGRLLLPSLQDLGFHTGKPIPPETMMLSTPRLRRLTFENANYPAGAIFDPQLQPFLRMRADEAPNLERILIYDYQIPSALLVFCLTSFSLRALTMDGCSVHEAGERNTETAVVLSVGEYMERLDAPAQLLLTVKPHFADLEVLSLDGPLPSVFECLEHISAPSLTSLQLILTGGESVVPRLTKHYEDLYTVFIQNDSTPLRLVHIIEPLIPLPYLSELRFVSQAATALSDEDLQVIARGLPEVTSLELTSEDCRERPTIGGLVAFAEHCPQLCKLTIPFNIGPSTLERGANHRITNHNLRILRSPSNVWPQLHARDSLKIAAILDDLFPHLDPREFQTGEVWRDVSDMLCVLQDARRSERSRMGGPVELDTMNQGPLDPRVDIDLFAIRSHLYNVANA